MYANKLRRLHMLAAVSVALLLCSVAEADDVKVLAADFQKGSNNRWSVSVTLEHGDTGWDHYADNWRVVDVEGNILGDRVLAHPHVDEQPFTRSLHSVVVPENINTVYVEAHDKVHGWSPVRLTANLGSAQDGHLRVEAH